MRPLLVVLFLALLAAPAAAQESSERTLSVVGVGATDARPDRGSFDARVALRAPTAQVARARVNRRIAAVARGLRAIGVARSQIATTGVEINRIGRRQGKNGPVRISFRAASSLNVGVDDLELLAKAIDVATERGATDLYGPQLTFSDALASKAKATAEAAALTDARARADAAAAQTGQHVVGVQSIDLDPAAQDEVYENSSLSASADAGGSTAIFAGRQRFSSRARVTYVIEAAR